jgi:pimeloyl-ACP methyl ester carboxylesterase
MDPIAEIGGDHVRGLSAPVISVAPARLNVVGRGEPLDVRVTAPVHGDALPILLFSHGNGQSLHAYGPLANYWAAQGFVVVQPTHLDSRLTALTANDPRRPEIWRHRESDLVHLLDRLDDVAGIISGLRERLDLSRIAVAGHSWGAQSASTLLGATHPDPADGSVVSIRDERVKAGVLLAVPGTGGANLSPFAAKNFPFMHPDFTTMTAPVLVIAGDRDNGGMTTRGPEWWREAYDLSPAPKALFTVHGGEHSLGGIPNYEARETTDERPRRVAAIQQISTAFLKSALNPGAGDFTAALPLSSAVEAEGTLECK